MNRTPHHGDSGPFGQTVALRILWEFHQNGPGSFRTVQRLCGDISPTVLNLRLKELREVSIVELQGRKGYVIIEQGIALSRIIEQLNRWAKRWAEPSSFAQTSRIKKSGFPKSCHRNPKV